MENLDALSAEELEAFAARNRAGRDYLSIWPGAKPSRRRAAATLAMYAENKAGAIRQREKGEIGYAMESERIADQIYSTLPAYARW